MKIEDIKKIIPNPSDRVLEIFRTNEKDFKEELLQEIFRRLEVQKKDLNRTKEKEFWVNVIDNFEQYSTEFQNWLIKQDNNNLEFFDRLSLFLGMYDDKIYKINSNTQRMLSEWGVFKK